MKFDIRSHLMLLVFIQQKLTRASLFDTRMSLELVDLWINTLNNVSTWKETEFAYQSYPFPEGFFV